jgi:hypothetical protein
MRIRASRLELRLHVSRLIRLHPHQAALEVLNAHDSLVAEANLAILFED